MNIPAVIPADTLPALIDRATAALECARTSAEVLEARDMARVAYDAAKSAGRIHRAKQAHDSLIAEVHRAQAHALAIRARAEMRLAEEYDAAQDRGEAATGRDGPGAGVAGDNAKATAADLGFRRDEIHDWRKLRDAEAAEPGLVARTLDDMLERGEEPTNAALKREVAGNYRAVTTGDNEWYTPREYVDLARAVMGGIDLDPASCAEANATVGASAYFTKDDDGLTRHWSGRVWLNPPYSRALMPAFCEKLAGHVDAGDVSQAILVSHNNTETAWFHRLHASCSAICFPSRRIRFYAGDDVAAPVNGQVFFYFGGDSPAFIAAFRHIGILMVPA